jgi:hypothetical protein
VGIRLAQSELEPVLPNPGEVFERFAAEVLSGLPFSE